MATEIETLDLDLNGDYLKKIREEFSIYLSEDKKQVLDRLIANAQGMAISEEGIRDAFHSLINPSDPIKYDIDANIKDYITEGLVDLYTIDFMKKYNLFPSYMSDYYDNVLFMRDRLDFLPDEQSKHKLSFLATIDQIIENTASTPEDFFETYKKAKNHQTEYELLIRNLASFSPRQDRVDDYISSLMRLSARNGRKEALSIIMQAMEELNPYDIEGKAPEEIQRMQEQTISSINAYLQKEPAMVK